VTVTHIFHFCRDRRVLEVLKTQISKPGTADKMKTIFHSFFAANCSGEISTEHCAFSTTAFGSWWTGFALFCYTRLHATQHDTNNAWRKCTMKERVIRIHFLPCFACPASSCKNIKHLVRNSSLEACVIHSQFCIFDTRFKTKMS